MTDASIARANSSNHSSVKAALALNDAQAANASPATPSPRTILGASETARCAALNGLTASFAVSKCDRRSQGSGTGDQAVASRDRRSNAKPGTNLIGERLARQHILSGRCRHLCEHLVKVPSWHRAGNSAATSRTTRTDMRPIRARRDGFLISKGHAYDFYNKC
jgi:hypothetical protein